MAIATMTTKGQITIPKEIRDALRLKPGERVDFRLEADGTVRLLPARVTLESLIGILKPNGIHATIEEISQAIRNKGKHVMGERE